MTRNIELMKAVREKIRMEPDSHDQGHWGMADNDAVDWNSTLASVEFSGRFSTVSCPTTACFAGWAIQLHGDQMLVDRDLFASDDEFEVNICVDKDNTIHYIEDRAQQVLGLTSDEAVRLFATGTKRKQILDFLDQAIKDAMDGS